VDTESSYSTPEIIQAVTTPFGNAPPVPSAFYPDIDLSVPESVYSEDGSVDLVWDLLRWEAFRNQQEQYEPLLVSFLHSTILTHSSLESSLAFLLANRLQGMMISTQLQALIYETLQESPVFRRNLRADILAVRDRDPACNTLPDVFLYFKGFHALQSYRVANVLWNSGRKVLAQYLQSQGMN
jgi:serine O-acetyltransferase